MRTFSLIFLFVFPILLLTACASSTDNAPVQAVENYLNALVKHQTGKTLREHIQDRLLHEAKSLLVQTDWGINEISDGLGFSGQAAFTSFFRKKTNSSPSAYRKNATISDRL